MEFHRTKTTITKTVEKGKNKKITTKTFSYESVVSRAESDEESQFMKDVTEWDKTDTEKGCAVDFKGLDRAGIVTELMTPAARTKACLHGGKVVCLGISKNDALKQKKERKMRFREIHKAQKEAEIAAKLAEAAHAKAKALQAEAAAEDSKIELFGSDED